MTFHPVAQVALILVAGLLAAIALAPVDRCPTGTNTTTISKGDRL
jgi:hypothetical protein